MLPTILRALCAAAVIFFADEAPAASAAGVAPPAAVTVRDTTAPRADSAARSAITLAAPVREAVARLAGGVPEARHVVVSLGERRLWLVEGDTVRFSAPVAVGRATPRMLADTSRPRPFGATPLGRFVVERRDSMPQWVPPDWHYAEQARKQGRRLVRLGRGGELATSDGRVLRVEGGHVVAVDSTGRARRLAPSAGREIVVDGAIVVPPLGTSARRYAGVLGPRRLALGGELGIHGTNEPSSIGKAATHGCIRLGDADVVLLHAIVPVGTPVYIVA